MCNLSSTLNSWYFYRKSSGDIIMSIIITLPLSW